MNEPLPVGTPDPPAGTTPGPSRTITDASAEVSVNTDALHFEALLTARGLNVGTAKGCIAELARLFPRDEEQRKYGIPDGTLQRWIDETFGSITIRQVLEDVGRHWEAEARGAAQEG